MNHDPIDLLCICERGLDSFKMSPSSILSMPLEGSMRWVNLLTRFTPSIWSLTNYCTQKPPLIYSVELLNNMVWSEPLIGFGPFNPRSWAQIQSQSQSSHGAAASVWGVVPRVRIVMPINPIKMEFETAQRSNGKERRSCVCECVGQRIPFEYVISRHRHSFDWRDKQWDPLASHSLTGHVWTNDSPLQRDTVARRRGLNWERV